jgi:hypothetical protein
VFNAGLAQASWSAWRIAARIAVRLSTYIDMLLAIRLAARLATRLATRLAACLASLGAKCLESSSNRMATRSSGLGVAVNAYDNAEEERCDKEQEKKAAIP